MLDPWIIQEIVKREEQQRQERAEQRIEVPLHEPHYHEPRYGEHERQPTSEPACDPSESDRGVVVIDI